MPFLLALGCEACLRRVESGKAKVLGCCGTAVAALCMDASKRTGARQGSTCSEMRTCPKRVVASVVADSALPILLLSSGAFAVSGCVCTCSVHCVHSLRGPRTPGSTGTRGYAYILTAVCGTCHLLRYMRMLTLSGRLDDLYTPVLGERPRQTPLGRWDMSSHMLYVPSRAMHTVMCSL